MSKTFDQGKDEVGKLCKYFATNRKSFLVPGVKEAHVRQSLIDPFFEALGWDVRNESMAAPQYREVIPEDSLDVEGQQKAPDYTFRVGTLPKFYVEAKKCGININADPAPAYQLRRYGFSAKLALSILTDFEELGVYDCASRPRPSDKASHARIQYFGFAEYPDRWREIWDVFSREAVWSGMFDQYAASKRKRGTSEVDSEFLKDIEGWRDVLARNLALRNSDLSTDDLNAAVQRIIDRIVFLRIAEDRGLESYGQLLELCNQPHIYGHFMSGLCRKADEKYNSGLFHFQKESGVSDAPDTLTPRLVVDDKALKPILQSLYFEHGSPYNFGVLPVEILGTVYERFLGKVIRLTAGHQAKVEEKPEVRKAGGVYYTPAYIVNYIVQNTIGKQIEGKSPADLAGGKTKPPFRVLDMACGSGSFLIGAYQFLLEHCLKWYQANPSKRHAKAVYQNAKGETRLTIAERKRILTTHIFGVDIDRQAVETAKLSLLLKALEGENDTTLSEQMKLFHARALPNLSNNIKCGNSLIASDFSLVPEDLVRVRAFDWDVQFPDAMKAGGFDAVIGNPPYVRQETLGAGFKEYANVHYRVYHSVADLYAYFIERGVSLLRPDGWFSYIVANKWMRANYGEPLRKWLKEQQVEEIIDFGDLPVFKGATTYPCIIRIRKTPAETQRRCEDISIVQMDTLNFVDLQECVENGKYLIRRTSLDDKGWSLSDERTQTLIEKIRAAGVPLGEYVKGKIYRGVLTGLNKAFVIDRATRERLIAEDSQSAEIIKPFLAGRDIKRYQTPQSDQFLILMPKGWTREKSRNAKDAWGWLQKNYPAVALHIAPFAAAGQKRYDKGEYWWELRACEYYHEFEKPKIIVPAIVKSASYAFDEENHYSNDKTSIVQTDDLYLLGVLNSRVSDIILHSISSTKHGGYFEYKPMYVSQLPIRSIDLSDASQKSIHDRIVQLAESMLALTPKLREATSESKKATLQNAITTTDAEIDRLVYELYGLTDEEIKIVEGQ
ncbi:MAG: Eco57I restriction-modification methylase domain-containing protein [candidate division Zixibacteria bacterium]|nr:Eco57I restriction-modification methylase domain-containing protein [candidate division Zixibacteria bacterium]MBU1471266.1 Eco57I restriction-modification methylase domain-containing protein [candidate division Zixibacteria bacterium]